MSGQASGAAVIDLGTNTFNLLVFQHGAEGLRILHSEELPVFLGKGGIEKGTITDDAFERGLEALRKHKATAIAHGASRITAFGTSALRNAGNGADFVRRAEEGGRQMRSAQSLIDAGPQRFFVVHVQLNPVCA